MLYHNINKQTEHLGEILKGIYLYGLSNEKKVIDILKVKNKIRLNNINKIYKAIF